MSCWSSETKNKSTLPKWLKEPVKDITGRATTLLDQPFTPYTGERTAGMSGGQTDAMTILRDLFGESGKTEVPRLIDDIGEGGDIQSYMNPYLRSVLDPMLREINTGYAQSGMNTDAAAQQAGAFGDAGWGVARSENDKNRVNALTDATGRVYSDAFNNAMGLRESDINRLLSNSQADREFAGNLATQLFNMGSAEQSTAQKDLDAQFAEFLRKEGYDESQIALVANLLGGLAGTAGSTPETKPSTAASALGAATSVLGSVF